MVVKQAANKSKIKIFIIQQIDRKIELEEICETKDITPDNLLTEIEHICFSGTKLNLDYYIDNNIDYDKQDTILEYFMTADSDDIPSAMKALGPDYTEEECRIMRIKFMSDVSN